MRRKCWNCGYRYHKDENRCPRCGAPAQRGQPVDFSASDREVRFMRFRNWMDTFGEAAQIVVGIIALLAVLLIVFQSIQIQ